MIPKIIHYCRFGRNSFEKTDLMCIDTWKKHLPDYEFIWWNEDRFDLENDFLIKSYKDKKWAFYTEYVRFYALQKYGGIYLDTDILLLKDLSPLLKHDFFIGYESKFNINVAVVGSVPGHPLLAELMEYYESFKMEDEYKWSHLVTGPVFRKYCEVEDKGEITMVYDGVVVYPTEYFYPLPFEKADTGNIMKFKTEKSYCIHLWNASWFDEFRFFSNKRYRSGWKAVFKKIFSNPRQPLSFYRTVFFYARWNFVQIVKDLFKKNKND